MSKNKDKGVLFLGYVNGESKWFEDGDEENDGKYVGEIQGWERTWSRYRNLS